MRNGCLPNLGNSKFLKRFSKKEEITGAEDKEVLKLMNEECWTREAVERKSHVHDSSSSIKNGSLRGEEVILEKPVYKSIGHNPTAAKKSSSLHKKEVIVGGGLTVADIEKDEESKEKLTVERKLESADVNRAQAAKPRQELLPKFGEWNAHDPATTSEGFTIVFSKERDNKPFRRPVGQIDQFHKVKTFDLRGGLVDQFHKIKTFDLRGVKRDGKERQAIVGPKS